MSPVIELPIRSPSFRTIRTQENSDAGHSLTTMRHELDVANGTDWFFMHTKNSADYRPCFTETLIAEIIQCQKGVRRRLAANKDDNPGIHHVVFASDAKVFNLGGDLNLFSRLIRTGDHRHLLEYAHKCIEGLYNFSRLHEDQVHSIAVVQGDALGGGFEAALSCQTIIAEEGSGMGFPEVLFDMFPGMGAYTFLTQRVAPKQAERMMLDGRVYSAEELLRLGVVDYVVPRSEGLQAARELIRKNQRIGNSLRSMNTVRQTCRPISLEELLSVTTKWVDAAMHLNERALKTMERLVRAQNRRAESILAA